MTSRLKEFRPAQHSVLAVQIASWNSGIHGCPETEPPLTKSVGVTCCNSIISVESLNASPFATQAQVDHQTAPTGPLSRFPIVVKKFEEFRCCRSGNLDREEERKNAVAERSVG